MGNFHHALDQTVGELFDIAHFFIQALDRFFHGRRKADAARGVLRAGNQAALLPAAVSQRLQRHALFDIQHAHASRAAELVRGKREHIDTHFLHVDVHVADRLHRESVWNFAPAACASSAISRMGWMVPISLFAAMMVTSAVSSLSSRLSCSRSTRPCLSTSRYVTRKPSFSSASQVYSTSVM